MARASMREQLVRIRKPASEALNDIVTDFVTTRTGSRTDCDSQILWSCVVFTVQSFYGVLTNLRQGAAPTCVHGSKRAGFRIAHQHWNTVRSLHREKRLPPIAHECVAAIIVSGGIRL